MLGLSLSPAPSCMRLGCYQLVLDLGFDRGGGGCGETWNPPVAALLVSVIVAGVGIAPL
jgi:hypothetical protein